MKKWIGCGDSCFSFLKGFLITPLIAKYLLQLLLLALLNALALYEWHSLTSCNNSSRWCGKSLVCRWCGFDAWLVGLLLCASHVHTLPSPSGTETLLLWLSVREAGEESIFSTNCNALWLKVVSDLSSWMDSNPKVCFLKVLFPLNV